MVLIQGTYSAAQDGKLHLRMSLTESNVRQRSEDLQHTVCGCGVFRSRLPLARLSCNEYTQRLRFCLCLRHRLSLSIMETRTLQHRLDRPGLRINWDVRVHLLTISYCIPLIQNFDGCSSCLRRYILGSIESHGTI